MLDFGSLLTTLCSLIAVASFLCACINYGVIKPLEKSISTLSASIEELSKKVTANDSRIDQMAERLARIEARIDACTVKNA